MFGKTKSPGSTQASSSNSNKRDQTTLISSVTTITGDIAFTGTAHIEGSVKGNVAAEEGLLTIAHSGKVEGDIRAPKILIDGHVTGNVYAEEHLELAARAVITGSVYYSIIEMEKGSQVNGSLEYQSNGMPEVRPLLGKTRDVSKEGEVIDG